MDEFTIAKNFSSIQQFMKATTAALAAADKRAQELENKIATLQSEHQNLRQQLQYAVAEAAKPAAPTEVDLADYRDADPATREVSTDGAAS